MGVTKMQLTQNKVRRAQMHSSMLCIHVLYTPGKPSRPYFLALQKIPRAPSQVTLLFDLYFNVAFS